MAKQQKKSNNLNSKIAFKFNSIALLKGPLRIIDTEIVQNYLDIKGPYNIHYPN